MPFFRPAPWAGILLAAILLAACSSSPPTAPVAPLLAPGVHQQSTQSPVADPVAGTASTRVAFTAFVPDTPGPHTLVLIGGGLASLAPQPCRAPTTNLRRATGAACSARSPGSWRAATR